MSIEQISSSSLRQALVVESHVATARQAARSEQQTAHALRPAPSDASQETRDRRADEERNRLPDQRAAQPAEPTDARHGAGSVLDIVV